MTKGLLTTQLRSIFMCDFYTCMLAVFLAAFLVVSPLSFAGSMDKAAETAKNELLAGKLNINKASAEAIADALTGIGLKKAEAIVAYRNANGGFKTLDDLLAVKGVGKKTLEKNKGKIVF